jgi:hypothetical protein
MHVPVRNSNIFTWDLSPVRLPALTITTNSTCIWEVSGSNLDRNTGYIDADTSWVSLVPPGKRLDSTSNWATVFSHQILSNVLCSSTHYATERVIKQLVNKTNRINKHWLNNSLELCPSWEATSRSATQEYSNIFLEPEGSLPCSQEPFAGSYPESDQSSPYHPHPIPLR